MVADTLVSADIERGSRIIEILDAAKVRIKVGLWAYLDGYDQWRMVLASPELDDQDYLIVRRTLEAAGFTYDTTPPLIVWKMSDPFIRELRRRFRKSHPEGSRLVYESVAGRLIEYAYVYRIS